MATQPVAVADADLIVQTKSGKVRGAIVEDGLVAWRGIPFAAPPIGDLRWRAPRPVEPWGDVLDASDFGPVPSQLRLREVIGAGKTTPMSEDCLTINVQRQAQPSDTPRQVMVWIYGGAYSIGASRAPAYRGTKLVQKSDAVFVTFNYRLNALGYLDFTRYSTPERPFDSNLGLRDQVAALEWVRDNIAAFGGDADKVTIFGQSAGGNSVTTLMCAPASHGLYARAIAQSSAPTSVYDPERTAAWASEFVGLLGGTDANAVETLLGASAEQLVATADKLTTQVPDEQPGSLSMCPVVDGDYLPKHPVDAFADGSAARVPLIIGTTHDEGTFFQRLLKVLPTTPARIEKMFRLTDPGARDRVIAAYPGYPRNPKANAQIAGDVVFWHPSVEVATGHSQYAPTWMYRFDFATRVFRLIGLGATHGAEVPSTLGEDGNRLAQLLGGRKTAMAISSRMNSRWVTFAKDGTVDAAWPQYNARTRETWIVGETDRVESDPSGDRRRAWDGFKNYR